jgi:multicomponent Na+:H+ antiporter subunit D
VSRTPHRRHLFNLFVSFEILLTASYVLTWGEPERLRAGAPYIVVSLLSSLIFLVAIALSPPPPDGEHGRL